MNYTLDSIDSGSNYKFQNKMEKPSNPRSVFDLSHLNTLTIPNCGALVPIGLMEVLPSDSIELSVRTLLRVMPQVIPLYSRQRLYIHAFYSRFGDLWSDFDTFIKKGYTGNVSLAIPTLSSTNLDSSIVSTDTVTPDSLADYLGLPQGVTYAQLSSAGISCLPFMMYERIYRDYFMNKISTLKIATCYLMMMHNSVLVILEQFYLTLIRHTIMLPLENSIIVIIRKIIF